MLLGTWVTHQDDDGREMAYVHLHGCHIRVLEETPGAWRWTVWCEAGRELSEGIARTLREAQSAAESELFAIHPPGGTWQHRMLGD